MRTGRPIVYTSSDSVFQVAAHEEIVPVETLYGWCETARAVLDGPHRVGRVIARPFVGVPGSFRRTGRRRDFAVPPPGETLLDRLQQAGKRVLAIGKVAEIFAGRGVTESIPTDSNRDGVEAALEALRDDGGDLVYVNLRDFDARYGHRNDAKGFARALEELDGLVPALLETLREDDLLLLTADHGCDPTDVSTEHTREFVPLVAVGAGVSAGKSTSGRGRRSPTSRRRSPSTSASRPRRDELPRPPGESSIGRGRERPSRVSFPDRFAPPPPGARRRLRPPGSGRGIGVRTLSFRRGRVRDATSHEF